MEVDKKLEETRPITLILVSLLSTISTESGSKEFIVKSFKLYTKKTAPCCLFL